MAYVRETNVGGVDHQVVVDHELVDRQVAERTVMREPFSWGQPVAFVVGGLFLVLGAVALARTGMPSGGDVTQPHVGVAGLDHTPLLAMIEIVLGLVLLGAGAASGARRGLMIFFGGAALLFGIITLIEPQPFHDTLGMHAANSWLFILTGLATLLTGAFAAVHHRGDQMVVRTRDVVADEVLAPPPRY